LGKKGPGEFQNLIHAGPSVWIKPTEAVQSGIEQDDPPPPGTEAKMGTSQTVLKE
jgi:hypothetical protein